MLQEKNFSSRSLQKLAGPDPVKDVLVMDVLER